MGKRRSLTLLTTHIQSEQRQSEKWNAHAAWAHTLSVALAPPGGGACPARGSHQESPGNDGWCNIRKSCVQAFDRGILQMSLEQIILTPFILFQNTTLIPKPSQGKNHKRKYQRPGPLMNKNTKILTNHWLIKSSRIVKEQLVLFPGPSPFHYGLKEKNTHPTDAKRHSVLNTHSRLKKL